MKKQNQKPNGEIKVRFEEIDPALAKRYLARNVANRNLRESTVRAYEIDMRAGNWIPTHQGVAFNDRGDLIDGQHRLTAIVRSGVTVRMLVTRGLPTESGDTKTMDAVDRGAVRSVADQLKLQHGFRNPNRDVAAATAIVHMILGHVKRFTRMTVPQILQVLEIYGRHIADVGKSCDDTKDNRLRRSQLVGALAFARAVEPGLVDRFLVSLISGASLAADSPILALRNFLFSDASLNWTTSALKTKRTAFALVALNSLRRFVQEETTKDVHEGSSGYNFFAGKQPANLTKIAKIFFADPAPATAEPDHPIRAGAAQAKTKVSEGLADRFIKSAKDIGGITPEAEALIARVDSRERFTGKSRLDYMRSRVKSGALEE
jgi:hypothetical protein